MRCWRWGLPSFIGALTGRLAGSTASSQAEQTRAWRACRLAAWGQTRLRGPSMTAAAISSPRWAGRQCRTTASGAAPAMSSSSTVKPAKAGGARSASSSWPIEVHTSV